MYVLGEFFPYALLSDEGDQEVVCMYAFCVPNSHQAFLVLQFGPVPPIQDFVPDPEEFRNEDIAFVRFREVQFPRDLFPSPS